MSKFDIIKPLAFSSGTAGLGTYLVAPKGKKKEWAAMGALMGALGAGPIQYAVKRLVRQRPSLAKEISGQTLKELAIANAIGTGATAGITKMTGGYDNKKSTPATMFLDDAADAGILLARTLRKK